MNKKNLIRIAYTLTIAVLIGIGAQTAFGALFETLQDNFNDNSLDDGIWFNWGGAEVVETNSRLEMTNPATNTDYQGITSDNGFDLTASYFFSELVDAGNQSLSSWEVYPMQLIGVADNTDRLAWLIETNTLSPFYRDTGVTTFVGPSDAYNSSVHKFFRIREASGTIYWDYSTDGIGWTNYASVVRPGTLVITDMKVDLLVGTWASEVSETYAYFDNVNIDQGQSKNVVIKNGHIIIKNGHMILK